jgi:hypothetical protein
MVFLWTVGYAVDESHIMGYIAPVNDCRDDVTLRVHTRLNVRTEQIQSHT